jgi:hypothetical protein
MASKGKKRTTFAKLNREQKVRDKRQQKLQRRDSRTAGTLEDEVTEQPINTQPLEEFDVVDGVVVMREPRVAAGDRED